MFDTSAAGLSGVGRVRRTHLRVIGAVVLADLVGLTIVVVSRPRSGLTTTIGDLSQLAAVLLAVAGCVGAARRGGPERRAWAVLASALGVWAMAMTLWTWYGLTRDHVYPFPSLADLGFVGYAVPTVAALLLFPRSSLRRASRLRELLDAAVIAGSVLFVSWATVLGPLYHSGGTGLTRLVGLAYPVADIAVASVVLVVGMRVPVEQRRTWLLFGGGLVLLTVTDSVFVSMTLQGQTALTGTPLTLGWVAAMVLIAAASQLRPRRARPATSRHFTVLQELLPTLSLAGAIAVAVARRANIGDVFLVGNAVVLLVLFAAQQVVAVIQRVRLANGLEDTIAARTAELSSADARFRSLVESSDDAIIGATPDGLVTSWNAAAKRLLGYSYQEILGQSLDLLVPQDGRAESVEIRRRALSQGSVRRSFESERIHKDGTLVPVALTVSPIYDGDTITGTSAILRDITDRLALQHEMEFRTLHDTLTGLPNRELLANRLGQALRADNRAGTRTGLLVIDLDRFKEVNNTFGYHCGDELLRQVGPRLAGVLRGVDTVASLGGDEFAVLLPNMHGADDVTTVAFELVAALEMPFHVGGIDLDVEASVGVVLSGEHGQDAATLLQRAHIAMYVAKTQNLGVSVYDPDLDGHSPAKLALFGDLRRALDRGELVLHYQPKVSLSTRDVVGVEALVRWQHPERGLVFPDDFIPMAEHTALIGPLTRHVLDTALAQVRTWADAGRPLPIAVNLSVRNLLDEHLADQVAELLAVHGVPGALLELEVTESAIMVDPVRARQMLEQLSALGVRISIDDFGAGYTSLSQLTTLPVSELKIDRSFVMTMTDDPGNAMIVQSVIDLGHNLGLTLVAEGVETEQALTALAGLDCDAAQGYHLCRPIPAAAFDTWCAERTSTIADPARTTPQAPSVTARAGRTFDEQPWGHSLDAPNDESVDTEGEGVGGDTAVVARLLERAQCGEHDEALRLAENALREPTG
ncbi:MAG TPA: EAL domain-containing protein, partial [Dermatophilaceae bacterium]